MAFVVCPNCGAHVEVAQSTFDEAVQREVEARLKSAVAEALASERVSVEQEKKYLDEKHQLELQQAISQLKEQLANADVEKANAVSEAKTEAANETAKRISVFQAEISSLKSAREKDIQLAVSNAELAKDREIDSLKDTVAQLKLQNSQAVADAKAQSANESFQQISRLQTEISTLKATRASDIQLAVVTAEAAKDKEIAEIKESANQREQDLKNELQRTLDMRSKLSTKMLGESLEQHCLSEFRKLQAMGAFPNATFEKDNQAVKDEEYENDTATKGDFIYREYDGDEEFLSIMFEMKTEADDSKNQKTNASHMFKLDRDRKKKNCEYAVLVSTLEADNDVYNAGIVDVSAIGQPYEKMYVVRPQTFIPIISVIRSAKLDTLTYKRELQHLKQQDLDILGLKNAAEAWVKDVNKSGAYIKGNIKRAIDDIETSIRNLQATKKELERAFSRTTTVENKVNSTSIEKLARKFDSVKGFLEEAENN